MLTGEPQISKVLGGCAAENAVLGKQKSMDQLKTTFRKEV